MEQKYGTAPAEMAEEAEAESERAQEPGEKISPGELKTQYTAANRGKPALMHFCMAGQLPKRRYAFTRTGK
jgi:hypothetical protein